jgi:hypothetical protein
MLFVVWITCLIGLSFALWFASLLVDLFHAYRASKATISETSAISQIEPVEWGSAPPCTAAPVFRRRAAPGSSRLVDALHQLATYLNLIPIRHKFDVRMFR